MKKTMLIIKKTNRLNRSELKKILIIKNTFWKFGLSSQKKWFKRNVRPFDYNFLFYLGKKLIGYTLLRKREYTIRSKEKSFFLLDTIIIDKNYRSLQLGSKLIRDINNFIFKKKIISILYCKKNTVDFYKKNNWSVLPKKNIHSSFHKKNRHFLIFNKKIIRILKNDKIFFRLN